MCVRIPKVRKQPYALCSAEWSFMYALVSLVDDERAHTNQSELIC